MLTETEKLILENQAFIIMALSELLRAQDATITANALLSRAKATLEKVTPPREKKSDADTNA